MRVLFVLLALVLPSNHVGATDMNPVTRVVQLLQGLQDTCEEERKKEEDAWETFVCWHDSVIRDKTASNAAASNRVTALTDLIDDLEGGKNENVEQADKLYEQVQENEQELRELNDQCKKDHAAFNATAEDLETAMSALNLSMRTLEQAQPTENGTAPPNDTSLLEVDEGFQQRRRDATYLDKAVELGKRFLSPGDSLFLSHILLGQPVNSIPKDEAKDWEKLNDGTITSKYESRTTKIIRVFELLLRDFQDSLDEATSNFESGRTACSDRRGDLEGIISQLNNEAGELMGKTAGDIPNWQDATDERDMLNTQIQNDNRFIQDTKDTYTQRYPLYVARKQNQLAEIDAIAKAKATLTSDENRDLFRRSHESQGYFFIQQPLNDSDKAESGMQKLITTIDRLLGELDDAQEDDDRNKEESENKSLEYASTAMNASRWIDENTEKIAAAVSKRAQLREALAESRAVITKTQAEIDEATTQRNKEHAEWQKTDTDDENAKNVVEGVKNELDNFYTDLKNNQVTFIQADPYKYTASEAGSAPPPPPAITETVHKGKQTEATGIVAIMSMIAEDIQKDRDDAKAQEDQANQSYTNLVNDLSGIIAEHTVLIEGDGDEKLGYVDKITEENATIVGLHGVADPPVPESRAAYRETMSQNVNNYAQLRPIAQYWELNYEPRRAARAEEKDGLKNVKHILSNQEGNFSDEGR